MAFEKKENTGALFANKDRKSDTHANARGDALIDGVAYYIDAWTNTDKSGAKYQSLKFKRKEPKREAQAATSYDRDDARTGFARDLDDDLPF